MIKFLARILQLVRPYKTRLALGILCGVLSGLANPLLMVTVKLVTEVVFPVAGGAEQVSSGDKLQRAPKFLRDLAARLAPHLPQLDSPQTKLGVVLVVSTIPAAMFLRGLFTYLNIYFMSWVSIRAVADLRQRLFVHLLQLSVSFFNTNSTGSLIGRMQGAVALQNSIGSSLSVIIKEPIAILSLIALLVSQQPRLTLISLAVFPICIIPVVVYGRKARRSAEAFQKETLGLVSVMHETFTATRIIKAYNLEPTVTEQFKSMTRQFISHYMRRQRATEIPGPLIEFTGSIGVALFFLYIAFVTKQTPGDFLQFVGSLFLMYAPIKSLIRLQNQLDQARIASEGVFELLATQPTVPEPAHPVPLKADHADVHFEGIYFDFGDKPVLRGIDLSVKAGQVVALVGSSGSGKTTLTNLLLRFYDPLKGRIRIGETDIRQVSLRNLRDQIAVVTQETVLFDETIGYNIALGRPGATQEEIEAAARHAQADEFIRHKPQGYDTVIGEKGVALSGGQRQRLAIARAILKNAPILVLDEATSSLDTESERAVQLALDKLMKGRTTICIAHRLSTIQNADLIVVMAQGQIVETGQHNELIRRGGHYKRLYDLQFQS